MSSILTGSTIASWRMSGGLAKPEILEDVRGTSEAGEQARLSVAVAHLLFAERAFDPAGNGVPEPYHGPEKNDGERQLESSNHESTP